MLILNSRLDSKGREVGEGGEGVKGVGEQWGWRETVEVGKTWG